MEIVPYPLLKDKTDFFLLWAKSFDWHCTPYWLERWVEIDFRLRGTPIAFCGVIDGKIVGLVGVMAIPTRNNHGEREIVGGIWGIATLPSCSRAGIGRTILEYSEDYFRHQGYRFSMLTTSRSIVAYRWYLEVGYEVVDKVESYQHFYKIPRASRRPESFPATSHGSAKSINLDKTIRLFENYTRDKCGFVYREVGSLQARQYMGFFEPGASVALDEGYLLASWQLGSLRISEIIAPNQKIGRDLITRAASLAKGGLHARFVFDRVVAQTLVKSGFRGDPGSYGVLMAKPLVGTIFSDVFDDSFICSNIDFF
jgi:GNAT superfamily N-acetyltransferase